MPVPISTLVVHFTAIVELNPAALPVTSPPSATLSHWSPPRSPGRGHLIKIINRYTSRINKNSEFSDQGWGGERAENAERERVQSWGGAGGQMWDIYKFNKRKRAGKPKTWLIHIQTSWQAPEENALHALPATTRLAAFPKRKTNIYFEF